MIQITFPKCLQHHVFGSFDLFPVFLVSLLLTIMGQAIISLSIVNKANWFALLTMVCHKSCNLFLCEWM